MKRILNERGNTLILVLLMVVIFTVTGLSLLTTTMNGVKKTSVRESDIQATELAEKGIDFLTAYLETETKSLVDLPANDFEDRISSILQEYYVPSQASLPTDEGQLNVKIYGRDYLFPRTDDLTQVMILHSEAKVKDSTKTIITTIQLGAKKVPDALKYAVGAYNPCEDEAKCHKKKDDGNMFLHGGVAIKGDLYVEQHLVTKDTGVVTYNNNGYEWIPSDLPSIEGEGDSKARLIVGGKLYKLNSSKHSYNHNINQHSFNGEGYQEISANHVSSAFTAYHELNKQYVPVLDKRSANFSAIDIDAQRQDYYFDSHAPFPTITPEISTLYGDYSNSNVIIQSKIGNGNGHGNVDNIVLNNSVTVNRLNAVLGNNDTLYLRGTNNSFTNFTFNKGAYIGGDLTIGDTSQYSYNHHNYEKFEIDGPIFVDGDLTIAGANVKFNSTIYVTGNTSIKYSRLQGTMDNTSNTENSLVLFGKDAIQISNNNVYGDEPNIIRGFFYSEELMEIYGVGSNVEIQGGIFGKKVVLNATRGPVRRGDPIYWFGILVGYEKDVYAPNQQNISPSKSRLKVTYNPELIKNPPEGLPKVKDLSVTTINRRME